MPTFYRRDKVVYVPAPLPVNYYSILGLTLLLLVGLFNDVIRNSRPNSRFGGAYRSY